MKLGEFIVELGAHTGGVPDDQLDMEVLVEIPSESELDYGKPVNIRFDYQEKKVYIECE